MRKARFVTTVALAAMAMPAFADATNSSKEFVKNAAIGGKFEIESSKIALQKSQNADVKAFAQQMIDDHSKADAQLKSTLPSSSVDTAVADAPLDAKHQKMLDGLSDKSGAQFDHAYISEQRSAHKETVNLFRTYSKRGDDKALKDFAKDTLPTLRQHMQHVLELKG